MAKEIFDQERPRSTMAQRLDEAFAGCDQWTVVAAPPRRSSLEESPRSASVSRIAGRAATVRTQESGAL
jgi:regulator of RNase E activity RraA